MLTPEQIAEAEKYLAEKIRKEKAESEAANRAAIIPLPGPLAEAFSLTPDIEVGKWKVRPFYDVDLELLSHVKHPLCDYLMAGLEGKECETQYIPRGPKAWLAAWIFTRSPEEAEEGIIDGTAEAKAKAEFGKCQLRALVELNSAIVRQCSGYSQTMIAYAPAKTEGEGEKSPPP